MAFLSIVIPVYNVKNYLRQSLDSIFCQKGTQEFEVIAVNDGSTDCSLDIIREYEHRYKNIRVINKPNEGVSTTRNRGLEEATGEYIFFMDADDLLSPFFFSTIIPLLKEHKIDILAWNYATFYRHPRFSQIQKLEIQYIDCDKNNNSAFNYLMKVGSAVSLETKIIRREILKDLRFDTNMSYGEDLFFSWKVILRAKGIGYLNYSLYYYRQTGQGAVSIYHPNLYENYQKGFKDMLNFVRNENIESDVLNKEINYHFARRLPALTHMEYRAPYSQQKKEARLLEIIGDEFIKTALIEDKRLIGRLYDWARNRNVKQMLKQVRREALTSRLLFPLKRLLK